MNDEGKCSDNQTIETKTDLVDDTLSDFYLEFNGSIIL